jgi:hypothetical protein
VVCDFFLKPNSGGFFLDVAKALFETLLDLPKACATVAHQFVPWGTIPFCCCNHKMSY